MNLNYPLFKCENFTKLRISAHDLKIEAGRYNRTPVENRLCTQGLSSSVEDDMHFMLDCGKYNIGINFMINFKYTILILSHLMKNCDPSREKHGSIDHYVN